MTKKIKQISIHLLIFILCLFMAIFLCMMLFDDLLTAVTWSSWGFIGMRIILAYIIYNITMLFMKKSITPRQIDWLAVLYILFILSLTFFKGFDNSHISTININPLAIIDDFKNSDNTLILLLGNLCAYIPIGCYLKYKFGCKSNKTLATYFIGFSCLIEVAQYIFKVGIFDVNDIILNTLGFQIGTSLMYLIIKKINLKRT